MNAARQVELERDRAASAGAGMQANGDHGDSGAPLPGEGVFEPHEMFFSRTDHRGVIEAGNRVFVRTSGYPAERLVGAPHRLIRHEDMPKGVFHLFWDYLKAGRPIAAYVKNRSRAGLPYWVFAVATPVEGGYLSVRIKPATQIFETVVKEYETLLAREKAEKLSPEQSAQALCDRLGELGFGGYDGFMTQALTAEIQQRDLNLEREPDSDLEQMIELSSKVAEVEKAADQLKQSFAEVADIPSNMQIMASRIERAGGPVSVLSINYTRMADEALQRLRDFAGDSEADDMTEILRDGIFKLGVARIQQEVTTNSLRNETRAAENLEKERGILRDQNKLYQEKAQQALGRIVTVVTLRATAARDLHRMVLGLDSVRLLCRVESGRLGGDVGELASIVTRLDRLHTELDHQLETVSALAAGVSDAINRFRLVRDGAAPQAVQAAE